MILVPRQARKGNRLFFRLRNRLAFLKFRPIWHNLLRRRQRVQRRRSQALFLRLAVSPQLRRFLSGILLGPQHCWRNHGRGFGQFRQHRLWRYVSFYRLSHIERGLGRLFFCRSAALNHLIRRANVGRRQLNRLSLGIFLPFHRTNRNIDIFSSPAEKTAQNRLFGRLRHLSDSPGSLLVQRGLAVRQLFFGQTLRLFLGPNRGLVLLFRRQALHPVKQHSKRGVAGRHQAGQTAKKEK